MTRFEDTVLTVFAPHRRAERLIDARLDARRGEPALDERDDAWLDEHLSGCVPCQQMADARAEALDILRGGARLEAPEGFAARVVAAARAEAAVPAEEPAPARRPFAQWALAGAAVAATVGFAVLVGPSGPTPEGAVEVSGTAVVADVAPDFEVRAPSLGAAELRAVVSRIAAAHSGQVSGTAAALEVRIPRGELVGMLQDLARAGEVSVTPKGALAPERDTVILRVNLD